LCKEKNKLVAEYSLKDISKPIGVSEYKLLKQIPSELKGSLLCEFYSFDRENKGYGKRSTQTEGMV